MALGIWPGFQDAVVAMLLDKVQPAAHLVVMPVDEAAVTVVEVSSIWGFDDESAPIGTAACAECRCNVGQVACAVHRIAPGQHPVAIGVAHVPDGLKRHCRRISIATVAHPLNMRAVDHIAAEGEAAEGILHQIVNGVEPRVGAFEGGTFFRVDSTDLVSREVFFIVASPSYTDIAKRMQMKSVLKVLVG